MKVLLTGASSFTGMWFAEALAQSGATVVAPLRGHVGGYEGVRASRVNRVLKVAEVVEGIEFGDDSFVALVEGQGFDAVCLHAARVTDYRSHAFDLSLALAENTRNLRRVLELVQSRGTKAVIATGSVFEQDEGIGNTPLRAFSPYGLSKGLTWQTIRYWCTTLGIPYGKFVIPNPFGPYEEPRFYNYLVGCWRKGEAAEVRTPDYLRDNIHVDLLARTYAQFVRTMANSGRIAKLGPSGYQETQGAFTERVAREMRPRLGLACEVRLLDQQDFSEPRVRLNTDIPDVKYLGWNEEKAWDNIAAYYKA